ncbi:MAG: transglycosylase family protein [Actinomycetota bacterium]|nr:transglycosylase family protein [Actinomycetota bacterium]
MGLDVSSAIASYNASLKTLNQKVAATKRLQQAVISEEAQIDSESSSISQTISKEQSTLDSLNGQIQQLVQAQLAQQLAAEAKARQAQIQSQGIPSATGISQTPTNGGQVGNWGGHPAPVTSAALAALRNCESGGNYQDNTGNGYYGAYQFSISTWQAMGFPGIPSDASPSMQDLAASRLAAHGWYSWPECALLIGLN